MIVCHKIIDAGSAIYTASVILASVTWGVRTVGELNSGSIDRRCMSVSLRYQSALA